MRKLATEDNRRDGASRPFAVAATLQLGFYLYIYFTARVDDPRLFVLSNGARLALHLIPASLVMALVAWMPERLPEKQNGRRG